MFCLRDCKLVWVFKLLAQGKSSIVANVKQKSNYRYLQISILCNIGYQNLRTDLSVSLAFSTTSYALKLYAILKWSSNWSFASFIDDPWCEFILQLFVSVTALVLEKCVLSGLSVGWLYGWCRRSCIVFFFKVLVTIRWWHILLRFLLRQCFKVCFHKWNL